MVLVELIVDETGRSLAPASYDLALGLRNSPQRFHRSDQSAIDCVKQSVFLSGPANGTPMPMLLTVVVEF